MTFLQYSHPSFVPTHVDWRHSAGRSKEKEYAIEKAPDVLSKRIKKKQRKQVVKAHAARTAYAEKFRSFRQHVLSEMEEEAVPRPSVELLGSEADPDSDLLYVSYLVNEAVRDDFEEIQQFVIESLQKFDLGAHFDLDPIGSRSLQDSEEARNRRSEVTWVFAKPENPNPQLREKPIDFWNVEDPDEDDDGGGRF